MPAYYPPSGFKIPWLIMPNREELKKIECPDASLELFPDPQELTWRQFLKTSLQPIFDYFSNPSEEAHHQFLGREQLKRTMQFEAADEAARDLGVPLDMRELHEMVGIGTGRTYGSDLCILPHTAFPLEERPITGRRIYGFRYTHGIFHLDHKFKSGRFSIPYIGLDPKVMEWVAKYGEDLSPLQKVRRWIGMDPQFFSTGRDGAQELLWRLRRVACLGDHDWYHHSTLVSNRTDDEAFPFQKAPMYSHEKWAGTMASSNLGDTIEYTSLNMNLKVFETIFRKRPEIKEAILKQTYAFFCQLEEIHERALKDPQCNKTDADNCCAYLSHIMLTHLFRMPFTEKDLTKMIPSVGDSIKRVINLMLMKSQQGANDMRSLISTVIDQHPGPHMQRVYASIPASADSAITQTSRFQQELNESSYPGRPDFSKLRERYRESDEGKHVAAINERVGVNRRKRIKNQEQEESKRR